MRWVDSGLSFPSNRPFAVTLAGDVYAIGGTIPRTLYRSVGGVAAFAAVTAAAAGDIISLAVFSGKVYAFQLGTVVQSLLEWNGVSAWVVKATWSPPEADGGYTASYPYLLAAIGGSLYIAYGYALYVWNGASAINIVTTFTMAIGSILMSSLIFSSGSFFLGANNGRLYRWNGVSATLAAPNPGGLAWMMLVEYAGNVYGIGDKSQLYRWDGISAWVLVLGIYNSVTAIYGILVDGGRIYAVTNTEVGTSGLGGRLVSWATGEAAWRLEAAAYANCTRAAALYKLHGLFQSPVKALSPNTARVFRAVPPQGAWPLGVC